MILAYVILCLSFISFIFSTHIKGLDDSILFRVTWPGANENLLNSPDYDIFEISTTNNEKFKCMVPRNYGENTAGAEKYSGPNPIDLLMPLFKKQFCTIRHEAFWTYELCHGLHIKQYHQDKESATPTTRLQEYLLGTTTLKVLEKEAKLLDEEFDRNPTPVVPTIKVNGVDAPYFEINYEDGTICDLTGNPRVTHVLYVCFEDGRPAVYSVKETYTCEYEIVVLAPQICEHPFYKPIEVEHTDLPCVSLSDGVKKPQNYIDIEAESLKLRTQGTVLSGDLSGGTIKLEIVEDGSDIVYEDEDGYRITELIAAHQSLDPNAKKDIELQDPFPTSPSIDTKLVEDFLNGQHCLEGGYGWWKYKFCHGKLVQQYHEEKDGSKYVILLGNFDMQNHKDWIEEHPNKRFNPSKSQVSHFYSGGDLCETAKVKKARQVEVKLKCKPNQSPSSVSLYLLEPAICEYVLGVETPLVCPLLKSVDENGLFSMDELENYRHTQSQNANNKNPEPIQPSEEQVEGDTEGWRGLTEEEEALQRDNP